ncbi:hypothetical protein [Sphingomonas sp.]|uniref:hypothetical protein n=1 Tax=Sphingomonas sp. TaxID=28214 RepID=UPI00257E9A68|nr:hypothetical protein [Sphingomonas sp.]
MITEIAAGFASLKSAVDIVTAINGALKASEVIEIKTTLNRLILDAQQTLFLAQQENAASADRIRELEQEIIRMTDWTAERQNYELREVAPGAFAYVKKAAMQDAEPGHWLCTNCFEDRKKSILQLQGLGSTGQWHIHACPRCSAKFSIRKEMKIRRNEMY